MTDDLKARGVRVTREQAQAQIDGLLVAEILMDFGTNFKGVYPDYVLARGVGPEQSMIGLAIKRGHLLVAAALSDHPTVKQMAAEAVAAERERCAGMVRSSCPKCSGEGWLWGHELDEYEHPHPGQSDDTRYSCDGKGCAEAAAIRKGTT